jgi:hypothetical protein
MVLMELQIVFVDFLVEYNVFTVRIGMYSYSIYFCKIRIVEDMKFSSNFE